MDKRLNAVLSVSLECSGHASIAVPDTGRNSLAIAAPTGRPHTPKGIAPSVFDFRGVLYSLHSAVQCAFHLPVNTT